MPVPRPAGALAALCLALSPLWAEPPVTGPPGSDRAPEALDVERLARGWAALPPAERAAAARLVAQRTDEPARLMQLRILADRRAAPAVRRIAIDAVAGWDDARAVLPLLDVVAEGPSGPAFAAVSALDRWADDERVLRRTADLALRDAAGVRRLAFALVGASGDPRTLHVLERGLADSDPAARAAAFAAAGRRAHAPALGALIAALGASERECALAAAEALAAFGPAASGAVPRALALLGDPGADAALRAAVPALLAHFADQPPVRAALGAHARHPDRAISTACRLALGNHGGVR